MKLLFPIRAFYPSQVGGPSNTLFWHTCALKRKKIEVLIVTTTWGIKEGLVKEDFWLEDSCGYVYYGSGVSSSFKIIKEAIIKLKESDIIHLNGLFHALSLFPFLYSKLLFPKKVIVWSVRGELNREALKFSKLKKIPFLFFYRILGKNVVFHSTSSQETIDIKKHFFNSKIIEMPNFILPANRLTVKFKKQFLFMGRIHPIKGLDKLIKSLSLSKFFIKDGFKLVLIGTNTPDNEGYLNHLKSLVKELNLSKHVEFLGQITGDRKEIAYAESFCLILPSESENFGNVVVESMNHGTPVIASKGTPWAILEDFNCGYHIENSSEQIALAIDKMISLDANDYLSMRRNSVRLVDEKFNIETKIDLWINEYKSMLKDPLRN